MEKTFWYTRSFRIGVLSAWALVCITAVLIPTPAWAQPPGTHPSYVSIQIRTDAVNESSTIQPLCGGVVIDGERKLVMTAGHCVPSQRLAGNRKETYLVNNEVAKLITLSTEADMAIFQVADLKGLKEPNFKTPKKGDILVASAYFEAFPVTIPYGNRNFPATSIATTLDWEVKVTAVENTIAMTKWIVVLGNPAPGFSGSPIFDKEGNFAGIISSMIGGYTNISSSENADALLKKIP